MASSASHAYLTASSFFDIFDAHVIVAFSVTAFHVCNLLSNTTSPCKAVPLVILNLPSFQGFIDSQSS